MYAGERDDYDMADAPCVACNWTTGVVREQGPHLGVYCARCDKWQTWIKRTAINGKKETDMSVTFPVYSESTATDFKRVLPGEYVMTLTSVVNDDPPEGFQQKAPRIKFIYRVDDITSDLEWPEDVTTNKQKAEYAVGLTGSDHWERVNYYPTMNAKQAIYKLLRGMLGRPITEGDKLDPSQFVNQQYKVTISAVPWTMDDGRSGVSNKITVIKPLNQPADMSWKTAATNPEGFDEGTDYQYDANGNKVPF